jgi:hypothetical protein
MGSVRDNRKGTRPREFADRPGQPDHPVTPSLYKQTMALHLHTDPTHRACSWCATEFVVVRRPGRPRLYCNHACRQRAYEHRHGFCHERTVRPLPGQVEGDVWSGTGYERGGSIAPFGTRHAHQRSPRGPSPRDPVRPALRPSGQYFSTRHPRACQSCTHIAESTPLRYGVSPSNELSRLRSLLDDMAEARVPPTEAIRWIRANSPVP